MLAVFRIWLGDSVVFGVIIGSEPSRVGNGSGVSFDGCCEDGGGREFEGVSSIVVCIFVDFGRQNNMGLGLVFFTGQTAGCWLK